MDPNALAAARAGKPMLPQQQVPVRYPHNSYYGHPSGMPYQVQGQVPTPHRSLSQGAPSAYSMPSTPAPSNGNGGKSNLIDPLDFKSEDMSDDPSAQQMFRPLLQSRSRPQTTAYYPGSQPANSPYYPVQRPVTPSPDYNMAAAAARGMRPGSPYGVLPMQQRGRTPIGPPLTSSASDPTAAGMSSHPMGLQSTPPPPPSVTPR